MLKMLKGLYQSLSSEQHLHNTFDMYRTCIKDTFSVLVFINIFLKLLSPEGAEIVSIIFVRYY
jgi:hypothetical protein